MRCSYPWYHNGMITPCGRCLACRINQRRVWTHRIMLESYMHTNNSFLTLTYDDDHLPKDRSLEPEELQKFIKRLRFYFPEKIRFFAVGEYGDKTKRPHYHLALFGLGVQHEEYVKKSWDKGFILLGSLTFQSASYVGGYVTKKYVKFKDDDLKGRIPEFSRSSNRPGIGAPAMAVLRNVLKNRNMDDVPTYLRHGEKIFPLGRYLRNRLRSELEFSDEKLLAIKRKAEIEMQAMQIRHVGVKAFQAMTPEAVLEACCRDMMNEQQEVSLSKKLNNHNKRVL